VGFRFIAGARCWPQLPGPRLVREVPDDHCRPIYRARHDSARLHRRRAIRPRRVPGRVPRPDPGGLRPGPAPVRQLVPGPLGGPVRRPPCRHRGLRQGPGSQRPGPRHRHPAAEHHRRVLQVRGPRRAARSLPGRPCPPAADRLRVPRRRPGPQRARRASGGGRARAAGRARADLAARAERAAGLRGHRRRYRAPGASSAGTGLSPSPARAARW